ncbi:DUF551 domain-containing protein [Citrobacter portucalensis]|nr:DUF551 domain-containing protein [Citrobacter portucalensis]MEB1078694.1 DUF551 domain-containing protein [Citrobacter portucalensis]
MTTNHPAHGPVSLNRLHQIREILSKAAAQSDGGNLGYAMADAVKVIDGSISAFDADPQRNPVLAYADSYRDMAKRGVESIPVWSVITDLERNIAPLYATPPSPVVPDDVLDALQKVARIRLDLNDFDGDRRGIADCLGNAEEALIEVVNRSAAMLQGAEPVSEHDELPLDYLQGHKDGLEWAAQMAEANHPQTGDWLYDDPIELARAIRKGPDMPTAQAGNHTEQHLDMVDHSGDANKMVAGNSPVIPDGWVACSERMPDTMISVLVTGDWFHHAVSLWDGASWCDLDFEPPVTHWMPLPAAPQQEVMLALEIGTSRYAGAMQKLVDSGD